LEEGANPMKDLIESSRLFEASSRMQTAANSLKVLADNGKIDQQLRANLDWVHHFLHEVDLASFGQSDISPDFAVPATEARPFFYAAMANIDDALRAAGIHDEVELRHLVADTFDALEPNANKQPASAKLRAVAKLLERFANAILNKLDSPPFPNDASMPLVTA
jgi:hypothetical protein